MKNYYIIAGIAIIAFIVLGASSFVSSMSPYVEDFSKAKVSTQDRIQVPGEVIKGRTTYDVKVPALVFFMRDPKGQEMKVVYKGIRPGNFDQASKVVAIGKYKDGAFQADNLLVKCPSKYQNK